MKNCLTPLVSGVAMLGLFLPVGAETGTLSLPATAKAAATLPLFFEQNAGQFDRQVEFISRTGNTAFLLTREGFGIQSGRGEFPPELRLRWRGASRRRPLAGEGRLAGAANYFIGSDPRRWRSSAPLYRGVRYADVYPGISMLFHGAGRELEQDWIVAPRATPQRITIQVEGASRVALSDSGEALIENQAGTLCLRKPYAYQGTAAGRRRIESSYVLTGGLIGIRLGEYDRSRELIIDPVLTYSTYLNDGGGATAVALDPAGNIYVAGTTGSVSMPTLSAFQSSNAGGSSDAFVLKLSPDGSKLIYATYLGGSSQDQSADIAVDAAGNAYVTGMTISADFPLVHPIQASLRGNSAAFISKLGPQGNALVYSTYLGGSSGEGAFGIAVDAQGNAYVTGFTDSTDFPTVHAAQANSGGERDAFVAKLTPAGNALAYATYIGGPSSDWGSGIAVDAAGSAYVTGIFDFEFPTTGGPQPGSGPYFVLKLAPDGASFVYSTYLDTGGSGIAVDAAGNAYVTGAPASVTKLDASGSHLLYSTYLGGSGGDSGSRVAVDSSGSAYVVGTTYSADLPVFAPVQAHISGGSVFKSSDGGASWTGVSPPNLDYLVRAMVADPKNSGTIYLGMQGPLFKTTDGGAHWAQKDAARTVGYFVEALAIDPQTTSTLYASTGGAVYKTVDGGDTWSQVLTTSSECVTLAVDPKNPARVYAGVRNGAGIFKSTDGGSTWQQVTNGLPGSADIVSLAVDPLNPANVYAGSAAGFYRSTDSGGTWQLSAMTQGIPVSAIAADPVTSGTVYAGSIGMIGKSTDGGVTWVGSQTSLPDVVTAIAIDPRQPANVYLAVYRGTVGNTGAVYVSRDAGVSWQLSGAGMTANKVYAIALDSLNPPTLYAGGLGSPDAFVAKLTPSGRLAYSTYLGGSLYEGGMAIAADGAGGAILVGGTESPDFPLKAPLYPALAQTGTSFVARMLDTGTSVPEFSTVSAASYAASGAVAPDSIASGFGVNLAAALESASSLPLPTVLEERSVNIRDSAGVEYQAPLFAVSPGQINYLMPAGAALGMATVTVMNGQEVVASGPADITAVAPGLFSANADGQGVAAAQAVQVSAGGSQTLLPVAQWDSVGKRYVPVPIDLGAAPETILILYGTGIRGSSSVQAQVGGVDAGLEYAGAQPGYAGLDQVNILLPQTLAGRGEVDIALTVNGVAANKVTVNIK